MKRASRLIAIKALIRKAQSMQYTGGKNEPHPDHTTKDFQ